jgi:hypothetical protein
MEQQRTRPLIALPVREQQGADDHQLSCGTQNAAKKSALGSAGLSRW